MSDRVMYHMGTAIMAFAAIGVIGSLAALVYNAKHDGPVLAIGLSSISNGVCLVSVALSRRSYR
jgi:energy-converting hydrogenase Eha subunit E